MPHGRTTIMSVSIGRSRWWCFTVNGVAASAYEAAPHVISRGYSYLIYQLEKGPDAAAPHVQGVAYFADAKTFSAAKMAIKNLWNIEPHVEPARDVKKAIEYCQKADTRVGATYEVRLYPRRAELVEVRTPTVWTHGEHVTNDEEFSYYSPIIYGLARSEHWPTHEDWAVLAWQMRTASPALYFDEHQFL